MVRLIINGREVEALEETTVLQAARRAGIDIPTLCYMEALSPYGACRLCTVEAKQAGVTKLAASCTMQVEEGLEILTHSPRAIDARRRVMEILLRRHPGAVEKLTPLARSMGVEPPEPAPGEDPCVLCGLCVRACEEIAGVSAISFVGRGDERKVSTPFDRPSDTCIACGACAYVCPTGAIKIEQVEQVRHSELVLGPNKAINVPFLQAVPKTPVIDTRYCIHFRTGTCSVCQRFCEPGAIDYAMEEKEEEIEVGTIVVATGFQTFNPSHLAEYGYGKLPNVITSLEFEKMSNAGGPTAGQILMADGRKPQTIAILHCVGSRDENNLPYCSRVCCMYSLKIAHLAKEKTNAKIYELYIDMRAFGKGYEEFYKRVLSEDVILIRGRGAEVTTYAQSPQEEGKLTVLCEDTLMGKRRRLPVDMVILSVGLQAQADAAQLARILGISRSADGFFMERHAKLGPVETNTDGIFLAGACQGPKDIPDAVAQGAAAAAGALSLIDAGEVLLEPFTAVVDEERCSGCGICEPLCPYRAISYDGEPRVAKINEAVCKGCGVCAAACPGGVISARGFTDAQVLAEIEGALAPVAL
jgi:heterodisulfide reductase subunit A